MLIVPLLLTLSACGTEASQKVLVADVLGNEVSIVDVSQNAEGNIEVEVCVSGTYSALHGINMAKINVNDGSISADSDFSVRVDGPSIYYTFSFPTNEQPDRFSIGLKDHLGMQTGNATFDAVTYEVI